MREHTTIAWIGTVVATSLVLMGMLLVGGLRGAQGVAAAPPVLGSPPSPLALNTTITPTLTLTVAEPIVRGRPTQVTTTVIVSPTQTYRLNFAAGAQITETAQLTGSQTVTRTFNFTQTGTLSLTVDVLGERPNEVYTINTKTITFTVIDPTIPDVLTLTAAPQQVAADGTSHATITATVVNALSEPISGTQVRFSSTLGTLEPSAEQQTNVAGLAVVRLTSATSSTAQITAIAIASPLVSDKTSVDFASRVPQNITLVQSPPAPITGDGASPADLSIRILDQFGEPVPNTSVSFSTNLGTWGVAEPYAPETIALRQAAQVITTRTTREGFARARLIAPVNLSGSNQTATVQIAAGSATSTISVIFSSLPSTAVQLTADPSPAAVCGSGTVQLSATLALTSGLPLASQPVNFTTTGGSFVLTPTTTTTSTTTDGNGRVAVPLFIRAGDLSSSPAITVTVQAGQQQRQVRIVQQCLIYLPTIASPPVKVTLSTPTLDESRLIAPGEPVTLVATANNAAGVALQNTELSITSTLGTLQQERTTTDASGAVTATLTVTSTGTLTVSAALATGRIEGEPLVLTVVTPTLTLSATADTIETGQSTDLRARLFLTSPETGAQATRALSNRPINFTLEGAGALTPPQANTDNTGESTATYTAPDTPGTAIITASTDGVDPVSRTLQVVPPPTISTITVEPVQADAIADRTGADGSTTPASIPLVLTARAENGAPISGRILELTTSLSSFDNGQPTIQVTTDANGQVRANLRGIAQLGAVTISVRDTRLGTILAPTLQFVPAACPDIEPRNNNVRSDGLPPPLGWLNGICNGRMDASDPADNSDFYSVELSAGTAITVRLTNIPPNTNYNIFLFAQEVELRPSTALIGSSRPGNQDEEFTFVVPRTERYYIRVFAVTRAAPGAPDGYTLTVRRQP
ncbi:hypothetical protein HC928_01470 [bacterium]|nr:hypothetical protein [bacterium]